MNLATLKNKKSEKQTIEYEGETLEFVYNPSVLTPNRMAALSNPDVSEGEKHLAAGILLCNLLVSWDLHNDGEPLEITEENCCDLPFNLINTMIEKISTAFAEKKALSTGSQTNSQTQGRGRNFR
jgi:hypothetical protein